MLNQTNHATVYHLTDCNCITKWLAVLCYHCLYTRKNAPKMVHIRAYGGTDPCGVLIGHPFRQVRTSACDPCLQSSSLLSTSRMARTSGWAGPSSFSCTASARSSNGRPTSSRPCEKGAELRFSYVYHTFRCHPLSFILQSRALLSGEMLGVRPPHLGWIQLSARTAKLSEDFCVPNRVRLLSRRTSG